MLKPAALDWQSHIDAGQSYLKTAQSGLKRPSVFNNALIYQITTMAVEQLLIGVYQFHNQMPADHTLEGLVDDLTAICPIEKELADHIKAIGQFDDMCPLVPVNRRIPDDTEIQSILSVGHQVAAYSMNQVHPI